MPIYQAVLNDEPERFPGYERLLRRKCREYDNQEQPFSEMTENAQLADWIGVAFNIGTPRIMLTST